MYVGVRSNNLYYLKVEVLESEQTFSAIHYFLKEAIPEDIIL